MKVTGTAVLHADSASVYAALNDPAVLASTIPGCESLEALGDDRYRMSVTAGVASIKGTYDGEVALSEQSEPSGFTMHAKGSGAPGTVDATVRVELVDIGDGTTQVSYDADAVVGGMVGGVGQRMLAGVSRKMAGQFFSAVDAAMSEGPLPAGPVAPAPANGPASVGPGSSGAVSTGTVFSGRAAAPASTPGDQRTFILGAVFGAGVALLGVLVGGWAAGRRGGARR